MPEPTSQRSEGPTPAGGAYAICFYSYDGQPVSARFANQMTIVEYDEDGEVLNTTFGVTTPQAALPSAGPFPEFDEVRPDLQGAAAAAAQLGAHLGTWQVTPRRRSIEDGPDLVTQAVCLARSRVAGIPGESDVNSAIVAALAVLENRPLDGRWIAVEAGGVRFYAQVHSTGAARGSMALPEDVDESSVIPFDVTDHLAYDERRLRDVVTRLEGEEQADSQEALRLARNALRADRLAQDLWDELLTTSRTSSTTSPNTTLRQFRSHASSDALNALRTGAIAARAALGLDALTTAAMCLTALLADAVAAIDDAHLRWYYHQFAMTVATAPDPATQNLHRVASMMVRTLAGEGLDSVVTDVAQRSMTEAEDTLARALDLEDVDGFFWLLFESLVPLLIAEIVHRALARLDTPVPGADRMVNLIEEKHVRVATSLRTETEQMYAPQLATWYRSVQTAIETDGAAGGRREIFELSAHSLFLPTKAAEILKQPGLDPEKLWEVATAARAPLRSPHAPTRQTQEVENGRRGTVGR